MANDLGSAFEEICAAMVSAASIRNIDVVERVVHQCRMVKLGDGTPSQKTIWERSDGPRKLRFQWRWYDQSQAFSIKPDMNILTLELWVGGSIVRHAEERYED